MDKDMYIAGMKENVKQLRLEIDALTENAQKEARYRYHRLKDELNEVDKTLDKIREITDLSWESVKDDVNEMWQKIKIEVEKDEEELE